VPFLAAGAAAHRQLLREFVVGSEK